MQIFSIVVTQNTRQIGLKLRETGIANDLESIFNCHVSAEFDCACPYRKGLHPASKRNTTLSLAGVEGQQRYLLGQRERPIQQRLGAARLKLYFDFAQRG